MKRLILLLLLGVPFIEGYSQIKENVLCVYSKISKPIWFLLSDKPKVEFLNGNILFSSSKESVQYPLDDFLKFTFESKREPVSVLLKKNKEVIYSIMGGDLLIKNGIANSKVYIYSADGMIKMASHIDSEGRCSLHLTNKGIYIIKNNKQTFKLLVK